MDLHLKGKTALVSGGSKGLGRAVAIELAAEGADVAVVARSQPAIDETVKYIRQSGGAAIGISADMTSSDGITTAVEQTKNSLGPPDIVVFNVDAPDAYRGSTFKCGLEDAMEAEFDKTFNDLVMSIVRLSHAVLPAMKEKRWGRLLNIGSISMKRPHAPPTQKVLSNTGRLGVVGLMKTIAYEYGQWNITANILAPGQFNTELASGAYQAKGVTISEHEAKMRQTGMGMCRFGRPDEFAAMAAFLCSERASYISGETITVTGAMHKAIF